MMVRRGAFALALAGPLSLLVVGAVVAWNVEVFRHGPGVPTAGTTEAWTLIWLCAAIVVAGHAISVVAAIAELRRIVAMRERPGWPIALALVYDLLVALPFLVWVFVL
jgi:hypothetical protein